MTLVLCTPRGDVLGQLPPFEAAEVYWPDVDSVVTGARERYAVEVTVLRLLEAGLPAPPGGPVC